MTFLLHACKFDFVIIKGKMKKLASPFYWRFLLLAMIPTLSLLSLIYISTSSTTIPFLRSLGVAGIRSPPPELPKARVAVCLVGGARRFELTGPSIIENVLKHYPNSDLFLHSPLDNDAFKLSLLRAAPRIASVRIFEQKPMTVTEPAARVLEAISAPRGHQGLLQYFNLVEGCLTLIEDYQKAKNFTYNWIVRTRVDGYWNAPLNPDTFVPGQYSVPIGSNYLGTNDRLGLGDLTTSAVALSRLSLIPAMDSAGFRQLNSESSYHAQFKVRNVSTTAKRFPFCIVTDRTFEFPLVAMALPVAAISSRGPLNGAYCRPCRAACGGGQAEEMVAKLRRDYSWIEARNDTVELCDGRGPWAAGWEEVFDANAGEKLAIERKRVMGLRLEDCVSDFEEMKRRSGGTWDVPPPEKVCGMGIHKSTSL